MHWEHRSFKEQGIELEPQIHLGSITSVLERQGIHTERDNINRIQNRQILQDIDKEVNFADKNGLTDFTGVQTFMDKNAPIFDNKNAMLKSKQNRLYWLNEWLKMYQDYKHV